MPKKDKVNKIEVEALERPIIHPEVTVKKCLGAKAITVPQMKALLDWESESEYKDQMLKDFPDLDPNKISFGTDYLFKDESGEKIRCHNNDHNRPFGYEWALTLAQEILHSGDKVPREKRRWQVNGETMIIGKTGRVLSAQHRGIALILAEQIRTGPQRDHWAEYWSGPCTLETIVVFGISEDEATCRTLDNVKPRTLADVLFCSRLFGKVNPSDAKKLSRMLDYAVKMLWERTGQKNDAYASRRTHAEAIEFIERHIWLVKAVEIIYKLYSKRWKESTEFFSSSSAAGLLYLMAASNTDGDMYRNMDYPGEARVNWKFKSKAVDFWTRLINEDTHLVGVRQAIAAHSIEHGEHTLGVPEKTGIIIKAWHQFVQGNAVDPDDLKLEMWQHPDTGRKYLVDYPEIGGVEHPDALAKFKPPTVRDADDERPLNGHVSGSSDMDLTDESDRDGTVPVDHEDDIDNTGPQEEEDDVVDEEVSSQDATEEEDAEDDRPSPTRRIFARDQDQVEDADEGQSEVLEEPHDPDEDNDPEVSIEEIEERKRQLLAEKAAKEKEKAAKKDKKRSKKPVVPTEEAEGMGLNGQQETEDANDEHSTTDEPEPAPKKKRKTAKTTAKEKARLAQLEEYARLDAEAAAAQGGYPSEEDGEDH